MLNQNTDKALDTAEANAVNHYRAMLLVILADISQIKTLGHYKVQLDGAALPGTADAVGQVEVQLGAVECAVTLVDLIRHTDGIHGVTQSLGCNLPNSVIAHGIFGTGGQLYMIREAELLVNGVNQLGYTDNLILDLLGQHKDVGIILPEAAYTHQTVQRTGQLMAVYQANLAHTNRQVTVAVHIIFVNQNTAGAVHRFNGKILFINLGEVHIFFVVVPMAAALPQRTVQHNRGADLLIVGSGVDLTPVSLQLVTQNAALGQIEREAGAFIHKCKQAQLGTQLAVVTLFGLLHAEQVSVQLLFIGEGDGVNALQHLIFGITTPVSTGEIQNSGGFYQTGTGKMRATAQVTEIALSVSADNSILGQVVNQNLLVGFTLGLKQLQCLLTGQLLTGEGQILGGNFQHFLLNSLHILGHKNVRAINIVIEALFDGRADAELGVGIKALNGLRHDVGRAVPKNVFALFIIKGEDLQLYISVQRLGQVNDIAVNFGGQSALGELVADGLGDFIAGHGRIEVFDAAVRESNVKTHNLYLIYH